MILMTTQEMASYIIKAYVWHCDSTALSFKKSKEKRVESEIIPIFACVFIPNVSPKNYSNT